MVIRTVNYKDHQDIPEHKVDWVMSVAGVDNIYSLDLEDINSLINGYEQWCNEEREIA
jgi:hypothetical protein